MLQILKPLCSVSTQSCAVTNRLHSLVDVTELQESGEILCHLLHCSLVPVPVIGGKYNPRVDVKQVRIVHAGRLTNQQIIMCSTHFSEVQKQGFHGG